MKGQQTAKIKSVPAAVGGWNARDSLANMPKADAIKLDNWFPETTQLSLRKGCEEWATGLPGSVNTLMPYKTGTVSEGFAVSTDSIFDISSGGPVGAAVVTGLTSDRMQYLQVGTGGGQFLMACNGSDSMLLYDGSTWQQITDSSSPIAITGLTNGTESIINLTLHKQRVWLIEKNSYRAWYLPLNSVGGAADYIDLGTYFRLGGYLIGMATWAVDGSYAGGMQDMAVFLTSEGECAVFSGTDPSISGVWSLVGIYRIGRPIGYRSFIKFGSDVALISADGIYPLSKILLVSRGSLQDAISNKIVEAVNLSVKEYGDNFGWQLIVSPIDNQLIINVPIVEGQKYYQYVMNTSTGSWARFIGWNSSCWELINDQLYFGSKFAVYKANVGTSDNGVAIAAECKQAFNYFGTAAQKQFTMARLNLLTDGTVNAVFGVDVDYSDKPVTSVPTFDPAQGWDSYWDVSPWDTTQWSTVGILSPQVKWQSIQGIGFCAALRFKVTAAELSLKWMATDVAFKPGGVF